MRYYLIAGEASGDLHGSNLIKGLREEDQNAEFRFWGGDLMGAACGESPVLHYRDGAVMGITEVLRKLWKIKGNFAMCRQDILHWRPDVVILIDYPGFNMKVAKFCHESGVRVFYYIAPKTWASRESRNRHLKEWVDRLFIVFPFEREYFTKAGVPFVYAGNPLVDAVDGHNFVRPAEGRYIAILAGSRKGEISRMMPVCMDVADRLKADPAYSDCRFVVAGAPARDESDYREFIAGRDFVDLVFGRTYDILKFADAAIINSGTASLEAALIGTPQVVCWSTSNLTYVVAKYVLKVLEHVRYISLGNLCLDKLVFRELLQDDFNAAEVESEVRRLVGDSEYRSAMIADYGAIRKSLGGTGASRAVAKAMIETIKG